MCTSTKKCAALKKAEWRIINLWIPFRRNRNEKWTQTFHNAPKLNDFRAAKSDYSVSKWTSSKELIRVEKILKIKPELISSLLLVVRSFVAQSAKLHIFMIGNPTMNLQRADNAESKCIFCWSVFISLSVPAAGSRVNFLLSGISKFLFFTKRNPSRHRTNSNQTKLIKSIENWIKLIWRK